MNSLHKNSQINYFLKVALRHHYLKEKETQILPEFLCHQLILKRLGTMLFRLRKLTQQ